jgi:hypothetical protein
LSAFDFLVAVAPLKEFAAKHALLGLGIYLAIRATFLFKKIPIIVEQACALDLMLIKHLGERRRAIAELPPRRPPEKKARRAARTLETASGRRAAQQFAADAPQRRSTPTDRPPPSESQR